MMIRGPWIPVFFALALALPGSAQLWKGIPGDIEALEKASKSDPEKAAEYAWHLLEGHGGRKYDAKQIFGLFQEASAQGSALGHVGLSRCYAKGIGTAANMQRAWKLAEEAGKTGHPEAWKQMGYLTNSGCGVAKNRRKAVELTEKAAKAGSVSAKVNLLVYTNYAGESDRYSPQAEIALKYGHLMAAINATFGYVFSRGEPEEYETNRKLIALLESRAALDHPEALQALAFVRSCQGDREGSRVLELRAARSGTGDGIEELTKEISLPTIPGRNAPYTPYHVTEEGQGNLIWLAYQQGIRTDHAVTSAASALAEGIDGRPGDPAAAVKLLAKHLPGTNKQVHFYLAMRHLSLVGKEGHAKAGELAVAHATYATDKYPRALGLLGYLLAGYKKGIDADLPRAHAAMRQAPDSEKKREDQWKKLDGKLNDEQRKAADELAEKGYPTKPEFIAKAAAVLKEAGELEGSHD
jgi:TPR repeat protein